jgi:SAM-dependent methyltransferase
VKLLKSPDPQLSKSPIPEGWHGWDSYAPFYDWENARTLGRRDVPFWRAVVSRERGRVLELGCGTGRILVPLARASRSVIGIDRSKPMLALARRRARRLARAVRPAIVCADIRALPFPPASCGVVLAPYGLLQSLVRDRDLDRTIAGVVRVLEPGGLFGVDLVPDLPRWAAHGPRVSLSETKPDGSTVTLVEAVRQDRRRRLTVFDEEFTVRRGRVTRTHRFHLTFRTLGLPQTARRIERAGLEVEARLGSYQGAPWHAEAEGWILLARKPCRAGGAQRGRG